MLFVALPVHGAIVYVLHSVVASLLNGLCLILFLVSTCFWHFSEYVVSDCISRLCISVVILLLCVASLFSCVCMSDIHTLKRPWSAFRLSPMI